MSNDKPFAPGEQPGSLNMPWDEIAHPTVFQFLNSFRSDAEAVAIRHPEPTVSCSQKLEMFARHSVRYAGYGEIRIAKGAVLLVKRGFASSYMLYVCDGDDRIPLRELKQVLNLGKRDDIRFYDGDVEEIVGLPQGGVSPFVAADHRLEMIVFDQRLVYREQAGPALRWDFAFGVDASILARPTAVFDRLQELQSPGSKLFRWEHWLRPQR